ncbi:MAG: aldo/keto reductase, partial [Phycisphaeraceae bacterium]
GQCDYSAAGVQRSIDASLDRLGTDHFDLLQAHDIECGDEEQILGETLPALARAREQGKARFVGVTALPLGPIERAAASDLVDTVMSYAHYTLQNTGLVRLLPGLKEKDLGVIAAAPLGMGLLSSAGPADRHPAPERVRQYCARAAGRAEKYGIPISKLAIQYATARPEIHTTLLATASPDQLRRHLKWIDEPINEELLAQIQDVLAPVHNVTWAHGRTENNPPEVLGAEARSQRLGPGA